MRDDLPRGFLASQIVHAAGETSPGGLPEGTYAVVLAVTGIKELLDVRNALEDAGIPYKLICEPDAPFNGAPTAIGLMPTRDRRKVRKVLGRLPLLK